MDVTHVFIPLLKRSAVSAETRQVADAVEITECCKPAAYVRISLYVYFVRLSVLFSLRRLRLTTVTTYSPYTSLIIEFWCDLLH
jgi:hypothetical protein